MTHHFPFLLLLNFGCIFPLLVFAEIPSRLEPGYAEAVLAYNGRDFNKSLRLLDELLQQQPNTPEFLELKALALKMTHDDKSSSEVYQNLITVKKREHQSNSEIAPYYFELGVIRFRENKFDESKENLLSALKENFNVIPCHFFLGMIDLRTGDWSNAEIHFRKVTSGNLDELIPAAYFYLGQIYMKLSSPTSATQNFFFARKAAGEQIKASNISEETRKIAKQIFDSSEEALRPFDQSGFFGNLSLITADDTNVLLQGSGNPSSQNSIANPSGRNTLKQTLLFNLGYSSSPLNSFQIVPSYRTSLNWNSNVEARNGEYFVHDISLYLTRNALARTSYGLRLEGIYTFQDQPDMNNSRNFSPYSIVASVGPYLRYELAPKLIFSVELSFSPQKYFGDSNLDAAPNFKRSGNDQNLRISVKNDQGNRFWNPGAFLILDHNGTEGSEFNSTGATLEFNDVIHWSEILNFNTAVDLGTIKYSRDPNPNRSDLILMLDLNGQYKLSQKFSLIGDLQFTRDSVSSDDQNVVVQYQYSRFVASIGITYSF